MRSLVVEKKKKKRGGGKEGGGDDSVVNGRGPGSSGKVGKKERKCVGGGEREREQTRSGGEVGG
jgi:hypothetical protein